MLAEEARQLNPLNLAFLGDTVWEGFVRDRIFPDLARGHAQDLHQRCVSFVRAEAQSDAVAAIEGLLSSEEAAVYRRGRNAKGARVPRNAQMADYRRATGFEALLGYLYLSKQTDRLQVLMAAAFDALARDLAD